MHENIECGTVRALDLNIDSWVVGSWKAVQPKRPCNSHRLLISRSTPTVCPLFHVIMTS